MVSKNSGTKGRTDKKNPQAGRKPKKDPAVYRYGIKLNADENGRFNILFSKSGLAHRSKFIKAMIFGTQMRVVTTDKTTLNYYVRLTNFYHQFQAIGNNYNQTVRAINANFGEKRAYAMLSQLEKTTFELVALNRKIIALTLEYEEKYLRNDR